MIEVILDEYKESIGLLLKDIKKTGGSGSGISKKLNNVINGYAEIKKDLGSAEQENIESTINSLKDLSSLKYVNYPNPGLDYVGGFFGAVYAVAGAGITGLGVVQKDFNMIVVGLALAGFGSSIIIQRANTGINYHKELSSKICEVEENLKKI